ncbi:MAG: hypothetical protein IJI32_01430 [Clostridia bacterium]|nr:hypothetical protein [Clostridia bacterium]MBQ6525269.1 hypothetical protein [Clostridia bacterium]MBQ7228754.1 hypothetical protein [Clostridia bacterium]
MSLFDSLQNLDIKRLAQEIVQDTANDLKDEINVGTMLNLLKEGKSPAEIAQKVGQDLNVVEKLQNAAIKNVKEEFGMAPETTSATGTTSTGSSTGDAIQGNKIKREDIKISEMPMSGKVDRDKIQFDDE